MTLTQYLGRQGRIAKRRMVCIAESADSDLPQPSVGEDSHQGSISHAQISCVALDLQGSPARLHRATLASSGQLLEMAFCH